MRNRKAVSPVIATLLLIAISVAASVVTYSWVMSMVKTQGGQAQTMIKVDEVLFGRDSGGTGCGILVSIRNTGSVAAVIQTVYVYKGDTQILKKDGFGYAITAGAVKSLGFSEVAWANLRSGGIKLPTPDKTYDSGITFSSDLEFSSAYLVKVVTDNGFSVEGTYYTPSAFA
jgi:flagellin-like protein